MLLFNQKAEMMQVGSDEWEHLLTAASAAGWQPAGCRPVDDGDPKDYRAAHGQQLSRYDCQRLADALEAAAAARPEVVQFLRSSGVVLCSDLLALHAGITGS